MSIARTNGVMMGTNESTLQTIANGATQTGLEVDILGDALSVGDIWLYIAIQSTVAAGSVDLTINNRRVSGQAYARGSLSRSFVPINGTLLIPLGKMPASRLMNAVVTNNGTGNSIGVSVLYELEKLS